MWGACRLLWTQKVSFFIILEVSMFFWAGSVIFRRKALRGSGNQVIAATSALVSSLRPPPGKPTSALLSSKPTPALSSLRQPWPWAPLVLCFMSPPRPPAQFETLGRALHERSIPHRPGRCCPREGCTLRAGTPPPGRGTSPPLRAQSGLHFCILHLIDRL